MNAVQRLRFIMAALCATLTAAPHAFRRGVGTADYSGVKRRDGNVTLALIPNQPARRRG